jgi:hypothetical protein
LLLGLRDLCIRHALPCGHCHCAAANFDKLSNPWRGSDARVRPGLAIDARALIFCGADGAALVDAPPHAPTATPFAASREIPALDHAMCMEFAVGKLALNHVRAKALLIESGGGDRAEAVNRRPTVIAHAV